MQRRLDSLGLKLNLALLAFFLVLGAATAVFVFIGFDRTQDNTSQRSREALEEQGKLSLEALAGGAAESSGLRFEAAAAIGQRAARYLQAFKAAGATAPADVARFVQTPNGVWYDPHPGRVSDVVVLNHPTLDDAALDDIAYSAALDALFPSLMEGFPDDRSGEAYHPITIVFVGANSVGRAYPPASLIEITVPQDFDVAAFINKFGPASNPERRTIWTTPYEDRLGKGLVITAQTPVYEGDRFRGIFEVDLSIDKLVDQIGQIKPTDSGFAFYVDSEGQILRTGANELLLREIDSGLNESLAAVLDAMASSSDGAGVTVENVTLEGREHFIAFTTMPSVGGSFAVSAPVDEVTAQAAAITAGIDAQADRTMLLVLGSMTALFLVALAGATYLNRSVLVRPIEALVAGTRAVAAGGSPASIPVSGNDELATLARSFNSMSEEILAARGDLERQVEERTRELSTLLRISGDVASTLELRPLLRLVIEQVRAIAEYDRCSIFTLEGDRFFLLDSHGSGGVGAADASFPRSPIDPIASRLLRKETVIVDDVRSDSPEARAHQQGAGELFDTAFAGIRSWMAVPLALKDRVIGMLTLSHAQPSFYTERHARLVSAIATQIAVAIENARLYEQAQQLAAVEERQRLARELHDSVSQALYGIALGARTARTHLDNDPLRAIEPVDYVLQLAEIGLAEMRALIFELRPESLETEGLVAAMEKQIAATRARYGIEIATELGEEPALSMPEKEVFYRVAQEALHNVVKHARASRVEVRLATDNGSTSLEVRDNGVGFDSRQSFPGHMGLVSFAERAAAVGARVEVESTPGEGTAVKLSLHSR